jgi:glutathione S-transferase
MKAFLELELIYFPLRGRAEQIRLVLAYTGLPYVDTAVPRERWDALKGTLPLGQVPILIERLGGKELVIAQSHAILRHLARMREIYGVGERQHILADTLADTIGDWRAKFNAIAYAPSFLKDKALTARYFEETLPPVLVTLDQLLQQSSSPEEGLFVGESVTFADLMAFDTIDAHLQVQPDCLDNRFMLKRFFAKIKALPPIAEYLAQRRPSDFAK